MKRLIVIAGPTASGKTSLSVDLAKQFNAPIISADSRQFYKELAIGTAKPTTDEMAGVPHYFIDSHSLSHPLSAGEFEVEALQKVEELFKTYNDIIVVGGSGMFIDALIYGTDQLPHQPETREFWNKKLETEGIEYLQKKLQEVDLDYFKEVDINNPVRLIRALEVYDITGIPFSQQRTNEKKHRFNTFYFVINHPREVLYERINQRVDIMIEQGLIEEVKNNIEYRHLQSMNTVGYKEVFEYLDDHISLERAVELIKQNTRRYAKRQLTWFRREKEAIWLEAGENEKMIQEILARVTL